MSLKKVIHVISCSVISVVVLTLYSVPAFSGQKDLGFISIMIEPMDVIKMAIIVGLIHGIVFGILVIRARSITLARSVLISTFTTAIILGIGGAIAGFSGINFSKSSFGITSGLALIALLAGYAIGWIIYGSILFAVPSIVIGVLGGLLSKRQLSTAGEN